jgi:hypothetical protein
VITKQPPFWNALLPKSTVVFPARRTAKDRKFFSAYTDELSVRDQLLEINKENLEILMLFNIANQPLTLFILGNAVDHVWTHGIFR